MPDIQAGFRKARDTTNHIANINWLLEHTKEFQKNVYLSFMDYSKAFESRDSGKLGLVLKEISMRLHYNLFIFWHMLWTRSYW